MRIAFMGTPAFAVPTLDRLVEAGHEIPAVYTQPPRRAGRGKALRPSPVQLRAEALGLKVRSPLSLRNEPDQADFASLGLDLAVVAAYGLILPQAILSAPKGGCVNVHASLLPRWRGAAPIQRAILAGDSKTGITIMQMEKGLDTGPMMGARTILIDTMNAGELTENLAHMGAALLGHVLDSWPEVERIEQDDEAATYAPKIAKEEAKLDFSVNAVQVERQVRAFSPSPGAWFEYQGERVRILSAQLSEISGTPGTVIDHGLAIACASGSIVPIRVQRAGRSAMSPDELLRGFLIPIGADLR